MSGLDKSLDDLINEQKKKSKGNKSIGKNRKGNLGASKKLSVSNGRIGKKRMGKKMMMDIDQDISGKRWRHDKFKSGKSPSGDQPKRNQITRVQVTNLALGVTNKDINDLFSEVGKMRQAFVKFDRNGRSTGIAQVVFYDRASALEAIKRYNGVPLDGKPMKLSLVSNRGRLSRRGAQIGDGDNSRRIIITTTGKRRGGRWRRKGLPLDNNERMLD
ncbi:THO complex subunit 4 [Galdieria sulphuraria]|nr:THO complex subunit 4 [Galdieria sulphuraria]